MRYKITDRLNTGISERIVPKETEKGIVSMHLKRYQFASIYCKDKIVLDAACGVGYGTHYLAAFAKNIIGLDNDKESIEYANKHYRKQNIAYIQMDISKELRYPDGYFDAICSFETIEHLSDINMYLREVSRTLKESGVYLLSTPYVKKTNFMTNSIYHYAEYAVDDLHKALKPYFDKIEFYGQRRKSNSIHRFLRKLDVFNIRGLNLDIYRHLSRLTGNVPFAELSLDDIEIIKGDFLDASSVMAVCRKR